MNEIVYKMTILSETKSEKPDNQRVETPFFSLLCEKPMRQGFLLIIFEGGSRKEIEGFMSSPLFLSEAAWCFVHLSADGWKEKLKP